MSGLGLGHSQLPQGFRGVHLCGKCVENWTNVQKGVLCNTLPSSAELLHKPLIELNHLILHKEELHI